jgi:hypothetical protein
VPEGTRAILGGSFLETEREHVMIGEIKISLCDPLNPWLGYQIRIKDERGRTLLFSARPELENLEAALRFVGAAVEALVEVKEG